MRRTRLGATLAVMLVLGSLTAGCRSDDEPDAQTCRLATPPSTGAQPDDSAVRVVEQGHTRVPPDFPRNATTFARVSIGAVLENTSDQVAYRTRVTFDVLDANGKSIVSGAQATYKVIEVPLLLPGAKAAIGDTLVPDEKATVADVSVTPAVTAWTPPGNSTNGLAPIIATVDAASSTRKDDGSADLTFTTQGTNCTDLLSRGTTFAWRDTAGKIVGGNTDGSTNQSACQTGGATTAVSAMSQVNTVPAAVDVAKTEVTALCDLARRSTPIQSGEPIN